MSDSQHLDIDVVVNPVYEPVFNSDADLIDLWGARGGGRSYQLSVMIMAGLTTRGVPFRGVLMRQVFNNVRKSLWKEVMDRIVEWELDISHFRINEAMMSCVYIPTGNSIFAHGFKASTKAATGQQKSLAGVTHAFIDEADEVEEYQFKQLSTTIKRTKKVAVPKIYRAFNPPPRDHWIMRRYYNLTESKEHEGYYVATPKKIDGFLSIFATYKDNIDNYSEKGIRELESYGNPKDPAYDPEYYAVNVLGLVPEGRVGRIFKNWKPITMAEYLGKRAVKKFYVMDLGFVTDPDTVTEVKWRKNTLWVRELLNEKGLSPEALHEKMMDLGIKPSDLIIMDREPRLRAALRKTRIVESPSGKRVRLVGFKNLKHQFKPPGSVNAGIRILQGMKVFYTEDSLNIISEIQNYCWRVDAEKKPMSSPIDAYNHHLDPIRAGYYTINGHRQKGVSRAS